MSYNNNNNVNQKQQQQQQQPPTTTSEMEANLPNQIVENILLEGIDSTQLIQNADIVQFSNILATLRYDLSTLMNEEIDEFQFQFSQKKKKYTNK